MLSAIRSSNRIQVETSNIVQGRKDITTRESGDSEQAARVRRKDKNSKYRSAMKISGVRWKKRERTMQLRSYIAPQAAQLIILSAKKPKQGADSGSGRLWS
jgi:hypothetical protein